ncbi:ABC transporter ATP-binding protein [Vagococcus coleopterorum]|uniref:ABC transporter ATP-binding protein n=1 Tax=Vagococcus coleopterorum TaxID=2714946 RepID=A0A6G8ALV1_9ENTE|nr:ABC transporter ATP-binding protein [Vagococcus coleopterorum]QIL46038.1 ABC transporter ATP-binding protein [Vagococcus coleopterorum]
MNTKQHPLKRFWPYLNKFKIELLLALFLGILSGLSSVLMTYEIGRGIDAMVGVGNVDFPLLKKVIMYLVGLLITAAITQWLVQIIGNKIAYHSVAKLREDAFTHLNDLPINFYDQTPHGSLISRFTNDLDLVSEACTAIFNNLFTGMTVVIIAFVSMVKINVSLTILIVISTGVIFIISWLVARASQKRFTAQQQIIGDMSSFINEIVGNQKIVKAFHYEDLSENRFNELNMALQIEGQKAQFNSSLTNPLSRFIDHLAYVLIGLLGASILIAQPKAMTVGLISSFTIYSAQFTKPFIELSGLTTQIQGGIAGLERIFFLLDQTTEIDSSTRKLDLNKTIGKITFNKVDFSYLPTQPLISDFNLIVNPGETIAIVGKTGAGKSTLVNLLMRFYDVTNGEILLDDVNIQDYSRASLRKSFGMVLQDTWLFDGTIKDNLKFGKTNATDEEVVAGAKAANIHQFIMKLPQQYETVIGNAGVKISDGQRQLLTIARTMISEPPMLILDEATSSVDTLTEKIIQETFQKMMAGRTSFVIAHRLSTIEKADKILVMEQGQIIEIGSHTELLAKEDGPYKQLYNSQFSK